MRKQPFRKYTAIWILLLAIVCIGGTELIASYFFAPEWFERTTAPVRNGIQTVTSFCSQTVTDVSERIKEKAAERALESQVADDPLLERTVEFADPSITELRIENGISILTGGILEIEYYNQSEAPWSDQPYGSDDIGRYGCGPTAMAMVVNSMTDFETDPLLMAEWAVSNHHWAKQSGSYLSIVEDAAESYGLKATPIQALSSESIQSALLSGDLIVALMGPGHFTKSGHFILLHGVTLSGEILVADPNSIDRSLMEWDPDLIIDELSDSRHNGAPLWAISNS